MTDLIKSILYAVLIFGVMLLSFWYMTYQYNLCRIEINNASVMYCLRHAGIL